MLESVQKFSTLISAGAGKSDMEQFLMVLELPDEQYDKIYPQLKEKISEIYSSDNFRQEILEQLKRTPIKNFEDEKAEIESLIADIKDEEGLSENKKDLLTTILEKSVLEVYELYRNPRKKIEVKIKKLNPDAIIPSYAHLLDAGADICSIEDVTIKPNETGVIVKTGLAMAVPPCYEMQVRSRSGLSHKTKLRIANAPGTIDSDYRGEVGIIIDNIGNLSIKIEKGQKIAQLILAEVPMAKFVEVDSLDETERGEGGFGSTGA
jgi:dUTP pyrophosphatase